jgi:hypothetical protein
LRLSRCLTLIIYREHYRDDGAADWRRSYAKLDADQRGQLLDSLRELNASPRDRPERIARLDRPLRRMMESYYPGGRTAPRTPEDEELAQQGVSVGYDSGPR